MKISLNQSLLVVAAGLCLTAPALAQSWIVSEHSVSGGPQSTWDYTQGSGAVVNQQVMPSGAMLGICGVEHVNNRTYILGIAPNTLWEVTNNGGGAGIAGLTTIVANATATAPEGDIGYNPANGYMYAIENTAFSTVKSLFRIDLTAQTSVPIGTFSGDDPSGIAFDNAGNCIVIDSHGNTGGVAELHVFDVMTNLNSAQLVSSVSLGFGTGPALGLDFDPTTNTPYLMTINADL